MPFDLFEGNDLEAWATHFRFSEAFLKLLKDEVGVSSLEDIFFLYSDEELLKIVEGSARRLEFVKFKQIKDFTRVFIKSDPTSKIECTQGSKLHPKVLKRQEQLKEWIAVNKLQEAIYECLANEGIDCLQLLFFTPESELEPILSSLKGIPSRKFRNALQGYKDSITSTFALATTVINGAPNSPNQATSIISDMALKPPPPPFADDRFEKMVNVQTGTTITFSPKESLLEAWYHSGKKMAGGRVWTCSVCSNINPEEQLQCRDCFSSNTSTVPRTPSKYKEICCGKCHRGIKRHEPGPWQNGWRCDHPKHTGPASFKATHPVWGCDTILTCDWGICEACRKREYPFIHSLVSCNECFVAPIVGIRYKCTGRKDYDLCEVCEAKQIQPYPMIKIDQPLTTKMKFNSELLLSNISEAPVVSRVSTGPSIITPTRFGCTLIQVRWNIPASNKRLIFSNDNRSCERPGSVSCYPAAFADLPDNESEFHIVIDKAASTSNWFTFGLALRGMPDASSDGLGKTKNTWGIRDDRSTATSQAKIASCGKDLKTFRKLREGDRLSLKVNTTLAVCDLSVNGTEFAHRFSIPSGPSSNYFFAMTFADDHKVTILPYYR